MSSPVLPRDLFRSMQWTAESSRYSAEKMGHLELRAMKHAPLSHEVCRLFLELLRKYDYKSDCSWPVRTLRDLATYWVRCVLLLILRTIICLNKKQKHIKS